MESLVNYSSEDEHTEDSPKRKVAERCPVLEIDPNKRNKGEFNRRPKEESVRSSKTGERSQISYSRDKETSQNSSRKSDHKEESNRAGRHSGSRDQHYHRDERRSDRSYEKKRDSKDDRRRKDSHRERERDYEHRELERDRRDRSDKYRRDKNAKDNSYREKGRRRRSSESPIQNSKDHSTSSIRNRNRSRSRSASKEHPSYSKITPSASKHQKFEHKEESNTTNSVSQNKSASRLQAVLNLPLIDEAPKMPTVINKTDGTAIALPTYYNPKIINPTKYAEQVQKRKLIWGAKKDEDTSSKWGHATFSEDSDGKVASKFMRLMGIKSAPKSGDGDTATDSPAVEKHGPDVKSRQAMFSSMEQQYEVARQVTHTMRGVGLGFGSQSRQC